MNNNETVLFFSIHLMLLLNERTGFWFGPTIERKKMRKIRRNDSASKENKPYKGIHSQTFTAYHTNALNNTHRKKKQRNDNANEKKII